MEIIQDRRVINDPLGQTHSLDNSEHCFHFVFILQDFEKWGWTDGRTDNMCENNYPYRPWLWIGWVDQYEHIVKLGMNTEPSKVNYRQLFLKVLFIISQPRFKDLWSYFIIREVTMCEVCLLTHQAPCRIGSHYFNTWYPSVRPSWTQEHPTAPKPRLAKT